MPGLFPVATVRRRLALAAAVAATAVAAAWWLTARASAAPAPDVQRALLARPLTTFDGAPLGAPQLRGKVVVVNFWASWCKPCRKELPALDRLNAEIAARGGVVLAVSIDRDRAKAQRFVKDERLTMPVVHDGSDNLAAQLDLPYLPCTYVLDRDGRVVAAIGGGAPSDLRALRATVDRLLSSSPPAVAGGEGETQ